MTEHDYYTGSGDCIKFEEIGTRLKSFYEKNIKFESPFMIVIGTDSQNYSDRRYETKIVTAICFLCEGHGGIFFYTTDYVKLIRDVRAKLHLETARSLEVADKLLDMIEKEDFSEIYLNSRFVLNIDAGYENSEFRNPKTHSGTEELIPGLVAWVNAMGYEAAVKPDSIAASSVADKFSK